MRQSYLFKAVHNAVRSFYLLYQKDDQTLEQYSESFLNNIDIIKDSDRSIGEQAKLAQHICKLDGDKGSMDAAVVKLSLKKSTEKCFAYVFILGEN
eukprot:1988565-Ditylum_brightwellii.AAC.1